MRDVVAMGGDRAEAVRDSKMTKKPAPPISATSRAFASAIAEGLKADNGGEVLVKSSAGTGRLFVSRGRIAWATATTLPVNFGTRLVRSGLVAHADLAAVFEECKRTGQNFAEAMIEWKLLDVETLRGELLAQVASAVHEMLCWPSATALFVPSARVYSGSLTFELEELLQAAARPPVSTKLAAELHRLVAVELVEKTISRVLDPPRPAPASPPVAEARPPPPEPPPVPPPLPQLVNAEGLLAGLRGLVDYRAAGFFASGRLLGSDRVSEGTDAAACASAAASLLGSARAAVNAAGALQATGGDLDELVIRGENGILAVRSVEITGLGALGAFVLLGPDANLALARLRLDRLVPDLVVELV